MQQYLPFTVLKPLQKLNELAAKGKVATVLTVYGIETLSCIVYFGFNTIRLQQYLPFTVLKQDPASLPSLYLLLKLQQYLPFTVLKPNIKSLIVIRSHRLQQYLPFTVLKLMKISTSSFVPRIAVATVLTVYGIETIFSLSTKHLFNCFSCNSTYRLRY